MQAIGYVRGPRREPCPTLGFCVYTMKVLGAVGAGALSVECPNDYRQSLDVKRSSYETTLVLCSVYLGFKSMQHTGL